ncbi:28S ribosomal protein S29, mitochondrial-like [Oopsacas minuta]|uniref:Small ribosomal subunit protein mS29 n=1 Tax=Oopsacas minuta TaxID=111878 RepID=A0AAV7JK78_9METZ|nr:28S ribosomal protein S29, mitochondrial-like [Oopsacas minuta]
MHRIFTSSITRYYSTNLVQLGQKELVGDLLRIPKSQLNPFVSSLPEEYTKFLAQCKDGHMLYTDKIQVLLDSISMDTEMHKRILITGPRGSGKSMTILNALLYSQQTEMLLLHFPSLFAFTHSNHVVERYESEMGTFYEQDEYVVNWLNYFLKLNPYIADKITTDPCHFGEEHMLKFTVDKGEDFNTVIKQAISSASFPSKVLGYILEQVLKIQNRPPVLIAMDGLNALFCRTDVRLEQYGPPLMPRDLTVMRTIYDLVFSPKYLGLLGSKDSIVAGVTNRGVLGVKGMRKDDKILTSREKSADFSKIFRPQALRESPKLNITQENSPHYPNGTSYRVVGIEGELRQMDRLADFEFGGGEGEATNTIALEKVFEQSKEWQLTLEVNAKTLYLHYKHLDEVAKDKIYNSNYIWKTDILLGDEGMSKVFNQTTPFKSIELENWNKGCVEIAMTEAVKDLWGRKDLDKHFIEEVYPLSSYGNPRLVYNLCRMVFEH